MAKLVMLCLSHSKTFKTKKKFIPRLKNKKRQIGFVAVFFLSVNNQFLPLTATNKLIFFKVPGFSKTFMSNC